MEKLKLFIENFFVYGLGGVISKIIPLVMLPIVTRLMPNTFYYGLNDLYNTLVSFTSAIAVMGMYDATFRLFFEKDDLEYKKTICTTAFLFTIVTSIFFSAILFAFRRPISIFFFGNTKYEYLVDLSALATIVGGTNNIVASPIRMQNKRIIYLIANCIGPVISYSFSIPLLVKGYYSIALPLASVISGIILESTFLILNQSWFKFNLFDKRILRDMLQIGIPLMPNILIYWIFNSSDKIMITNLIGVESAGIYAVSSKIGHVSQLIYTAFAGGWQFFAFSTMKEKKQVENNSKVFEYLMVISLSTYILYCSFSYWIFKVLFTDNYLSGHISSTYLFLAPLLQMLFQVACSQFIIIKKTWINMCILALGAIVNVMLNIILIPSIGIEGASIATLIGYILSLTICIIVLVNMNLMYISKREILIFLISVIFFIIWRLVTFEYIILNILLIVSIYMIFAYLYKIDICFLFQKLKDGRR